MTDVVREINAAQPARSHGPLAWVMGHVRLLALIVLAGLGVSGALVYFGVLGIDQLDEEIRQRVLAKLRAKYPQLEISIDAARLIQGHGIQIRGLSIVQNAPQGGAGELVYVDEILATCDTSLQELLAHEPHITHLTLRHPRLNLVLLPGGRWNMEALLTPHESQRSPIPIAVEDGVVSLLNPEVNAQQPLVLKDLDLWLSPDASPEGAAALPQATSRRRLKITGSLACDHCQSLAFEGWVDPGSLKWAVRGQMNELLISPALENALPLAIPTRIVSLHDLHARASLQFEATNQALAEVSGALPFSFALAGQLSEGRLEDARLPNPITDAKAQFSADNAGIRVEQIEGRCGQAHLALRLERKGWDWSAPLSIRGTARQVPLDSQVAAVLDKQQRAVWDKFAPTGAFHASFDFQFDGRRWNPRASVELVDVSVAYEKFPYRILGVGGTIAWENGELRLDARGQASAGGAPVTVRGCLRAPGPDFTGWLEVASTGVVNIDDRLMGALEGPAERIVRSLQPRGKLKFHFRLDRDDPAQKPAPHLVIDIVDGAICYEKFRYPLDRITGQIVWRDGNWTFGHLRGFNRGACVLGEGSLARDGAGRQLLRWNFEADDVPLEDDLKFALPAAAQKTWEQLKPSGALDHLSIWFVHDCEAKSSSVEFEARESPARPGNATRPLTLEPEHLGLRFDQVTGTVRYRDGDVTVTGMRGMFGRTRVAADARCLLNADGGWSIQFHKSSIDGLNVNRELAAALPHPLGELLMRHQVAGQVSLHGSGAIAGNGRSPRPASAAWDVELALVDASINAGVPLDQIQGALHLTGRYEPRLLEAEGLLDIDFARCQGVPITEIRGPLRIENTRLLLGRWSQPPSQAGAVPRQVTARVFGGSVAGDGVVSLAGDKAFEAQAALNGADLKRVSAEAFPGRNKLNGTAQGFIELAGAGSQKHTWKGRGIVQLREADIYELPVMVALLKILSVRPPDKKGFDSSDCEFRIEGEHIYVEKLNFRGDAVTLIGRGDLDWQKRLNLQFHTMVGRDSLQVPVLRPLLGEASRQIMQIHVGGTIDQPLMTRQALPNITPLVNELMSELLQEPRNKS